ncbi:MAG: hypothetical protein R3D55_10480 [Chloroflexota bacterium]
MFAVLENGRFVLIALWWGGRGERGVERPFGQWQTAVPLRTNNR